MNHMEFKQLDALLDALKHTGLTQVRLGPVLCVKPSHKTSPVRITGLCLSARYKSMFFEWSKSFQDEGRAGTIKIIPEAFVRELLSLRKKVSAAGFRCAYGSFKMTCET